jgi:MFS superfamily sulfate permease-like transporter
VLLAAIVSVLFLVARAARPHVAFLGRIPGTRRFSDLERHPDNEVLPGILIFRVESALLYFNCEPVRQIVLAKSQEAPELRLVICDLSDSPHVDIAAARMLAGLHRDLTKRGASLRIVEAHSTVRDLLRAEGLEERVGYLGRHMSVLQALAEMEEKSEPPPVA